MAEETATDLSTLDALITDPKIRRVFVAAALASIKGIKKGSQRALVEVITRLSAYESYLTQTHRKVATIKTFAAPMQPGLTTRSLRTHEAN